MYLKIIFISVGKAPKMAKEKVFFEEAGARVTSTMFVDPSGDQYPIRNITSVQVRFKPMNIQQATIAKWFGILLAVLGILMGATGEGDTGGALVVIGAVLVYLWWSNKILIHLGAGGVQQEAYSHPARKKENAERVQRLAKAINDAVAHIQS